MNAISPEDAILTSFKSALASAYPARIVTRSLKDFADRKKEDLAKGVFTIIANGQPEGDTYEQKLKLLVVGQIELDEQATGEDIERAELLMARDVKNLVQRQVRGPDLRITGIDQSAQLEAPYGWVSLAVEAGPYDGTEPLTDDEGIGHLTDFLSFAAAIDIDQPHQSAAEHAKWTQEPPDYTTSKPDLQMQTDLPRSQP